MWHLGKWFSGGYGCVRRLTVGLDEFKDFFSNLNDSKT